MSTWQVAYLIGFYANIDFYSVIATHFTWSAFCQYVVISNETYQYSKKKIENPQETIYTP